MGCPCSHPTSLSFFRVDSPHVGTERQKGKEKCLASWLYLRDFSKTQREIIMRRCCSLETGPQTTLYVRKVTESADLREEAAAMHEKSL